MDKIVGIFVSLTVVPKAQGMGCWLSVLLGSCWVEESDSWSQEKIAGRCQICPAVSCENSFRKSFQPQASSSLVGFH